MALKLNHRYNYPQISTEAVRVEKNILTYMVFSDRYMEWYSEYEATYINEEDEETNIKRDVYRCHKYHTFYRREALTGAEAYRHFDEDIWYAKMFNSGSGNNIILAFSSERMAMKMLDLFKEYIFGIVAQSHEDERSVATEAQ